jgi:hypothetical protein
MSRAVRPTLERPAVIAVVSRQAEIDRPGSARLKAAEDSPQTHNWCAKWRIDFKLEMSGGA